MLKSFIVIGTIKRNTDDKNKFFEEVEEFIKSISTTYEIVHSDDKVRSYEVNTFIHQRTIEELKENCHSYEVNKNEYKIDIRIAYVINDQLSAMTMKDLETVKAECDKAIDECGCFYTESMMGRSEYFYTMIFDEECFPDISKECFPDDPKFNKSTINDRTFLFLRGGIKYKDFLANLKSIAR
jgi:hypothetical protein